MNREENFIIEKASPEQLSVVTSFMKVLYEDDLSNYWNFICKIDKARLHGVHLGSEIDFLNLVEESRNKQRSFYDKIKDNYGISDTARYTESGEVVIYLIENVQVPINFIADTEVVAFKVTLCLEIENKEANEYSTTWKIRMFEENNHSILNYKL